MSEFKREHRYIIFKLSDLGNSLKGDEIKSLANEYAHHRAFLGKPPLECVVIENDWPEYELVWSMIEERMSGKTNYIQHVPDHCDRIIWRGQYYHLTEGTSPKGID